jgi:hypothetical protein
MQQDWIAAAAFDIVDPVRRGAARPFDMKMS